MRRKLFQWRSKDGVAHSFGRALALTLTAVLLLLLGSGTAIHLYVRNLGPRSKERIIRALDERFDADVHIDSIEISMFPHPGVVVEGISVKHRLWTSPHPMIYIRHLAARTSYATLVAKGDEVDLVKLDGLLLYLPRRQNRGLDDRSTTSHDDERGKGEQRLHFLIKQIIADGTVLEIEPKQPGKQSLHFAFAKLSLTSGSPSRELAFKADLSNPKPPGEIITAGSFGPWNRDDPRATPVSGEYRFENANLGVFKGIRGTLSSSGEYGGRLDHIDVKGNTETPDFALTRGGEPLPLKTTFHSIVDGRDGDTRLDRVDATLGTSEFLCRGDIAHIPGSEGKTIALQAETKGARIEDILKLVLGSAQTTMTGPVDFRSSILIPQGKEPVIEKLQLQGTFSVPSAKFTSPKVERTLTTLSLRARGIDKEEQAGKKYGSVASNLMAAFTLRHGVTSFSNFSFAVPGATVRLTGSFNLRSQQIDMRGVFRMQAKLSDTQSGFKHLALIPLSPLFEKDGAGFEIPIEITGTRKQPVFGASIFHHRVTIH